MILTLSLLCHGLLWSEASAQDHLATQEPDSYKMDVNVRIYDIDQKTSYSLLEVFIRLGPLPWQFNETGVLVQILGGGDIMLVCRHIADDSLGRYFEGNASSSWYFVGDGELFPFDHYTMEFRVTPFIDANFTVDDASVIFRGPKQRPLSDAWETQNSYNELPCLVSNSTELKLTVSIVRRSVVPFLAFVLPIIICYYFLGASLFLDPKERIQEILAVYISLFVFVPVFFTGIQDFIPYRSVFTIPELLLIYLITSIGFLGISMMMSQYVKELKIHGKSLPPSEWFGLILSLGVLFPYYLLFFFPILWRSWSMGSILTFLLVIGSYAFGIIGFRHRLKKERTGKADPSYFLGCYE